MDIIASCKQNDGFPDIFRNINVPNDTNHMQEVPSGGAVPEPTVIVFFRRRSLHLNHETTFGNCFIYLFK